MFTAITEKKNDVSGIKKPWNNKGKKMVQEDREKRWRG